MTGHTVRDAHMGDLPAIVRIENRSFSTPWPRDALKNYVDANGRLCLVAEAGGTVVGYLNAITVLDEIHIGSVASDPDFRRRGIGGRLVRELIRRAGNTGAKYIFLEVRESNVAARSLYTGFGFRETARRRNYYESPKEDAILMILFIGEKIDACTFN